jgi:lysine-N-methylase
MNATTHRSWMVRDFVCTGAACPDTCCKGWGMQVDARTVTMYQTHAPALLNALMEEASDAVMKRDAVSNYCVKFTDGLCGIQQEHGTDYLSDACHFYPRITRMLGEERIVSATLSCPEIARLALYSSFDASFHTDSEVPPRLPIAMKDYLPEGVSGATAWEVHQTFIEAVLKEDITPEHAVLRILASDISSPIPAPESHPADNFNLLNVLLALIGASHHAPSPRLQQTLREMISALRVSVDPVMVTLIASEASLPAMQAMQERWHTHYATAFAPILRRWIAAQLSLTTHPFAGGGENTDDRAALLALRYATLRLALMSACEAAGGVASEADIIRVVQSLSRFTDHLAETETSLALYRQAGFTSLARLRGMLET